MTTHPNPEDDRPEWEIEHDIPEEAVNDPEDVYEMAGMFLEQLQYDLQGYDASVMQAALLSAFPELTPVQIATLMQPFYFRDQLERGIVVSVTRATMAGPGMFSFEGTIGFSPELRAFLGLPEDVPD